MPEVTSSKQGLEHGVLYEDPGNGPQWVLGKLMSLLPGPCCLPPEDMASDNGVH